eukprot:CAMPEP_0168352936 /NCGR_PEP_ID=MMETSP0213-20121227/22896_1 /TAXON_ID=151035 /ORGANISM="Euplotes harpa, Strain FSP1.4" /LENGTH=67 /DNA_ID=CAMNT_0008364339 /DNA_START=261 /DNA_END=464 /DNA_ORIENTATION=-
MNDLQDLMYFDNLTGEARQVLINRNKADVQNNKREEQKAGRGENRQAEREFLDQLKKSFDEIDIDNL